jgi:hypothetical protein
VNNEHEVDLWCRRIFFFCPLFSPVILILNLHIFPFISLHNLTRRLLHFANSLFLFCCSFSQQNSSIVASFFLSFLLFCITNFSIEWTAFLLRDHAISFSTFQYHCRHIWPTMYQDKCYTSTSTWFMIHFALIILTLNAIGSQLLTTLLNKA